MLYPISKPKPNSADSLAGFIDAEGRVVVPPSFEAASYFSEGKGAVVYADGNSGFLDNLGAQVIPPLFQGLGRFHDGLCSIGSGGRVGYIDHGGNWFISPQFLIASSFSEGRA